MMRTIVLPHVLCGQRTAAVLFVAGAFATPAAALESCVTCSDPPGVYRCSVDVPAKLASVGGVNRAAHLLCSRELAREGGHGKCAVRRNGDPAQCDGPVRTVSIDQALKALEPPAQPTPTAPTASTPGGEPKEDAPPRTMLELAQRTGEASKQEMKKAGNAMQRTWECLASLFQQC